MKPLVFINEACRLCRFLDSKEIYSTVSQQPPTPLLLVYVFILSMFASTEHPLCLSSQSFLPFMFYPLPPFPSPSFLLHPHPPFSPPALSPSLLSVTGNFASLRFCGHDKGGRCPLAGYVTGCHMRQTLWDGPELSAVTTQITSTASHLISTSNSISGN